MKQLHQPVMLNECLTALNIKADGCYLDSTLGRGGHSFALLKLLGEKARLIAFDKDREAINYVKKVCKDRRLELVQKPFSNIEAVLGERGLIGKVDGVMMDLGLSSPQLDNPKRGFSFLQDGPLDMRIDTSKQLTAAEWLKKASEKEIADVLYKYGDEKKSRLIARAIKKAKTPITTTKQLANLVVNIVSNYKQKKHPATRTFQALRIFINQELSELEQTLTQLLICLKLHGRLAIISFHSLEDRIVKKFINQHSKPKPLPKYLPIISADKVMPLKFIGRYFPSSDEIKNNVRARSAVLRVAEKVTSY